MTDRICRIIASELPGFLVEVSPDDDLEEWSQLDRLCVAVALEEEFLIEIPDRALEAWETVQDIINTVGELV